MGGVYTCKPRGAIIDRRHTACNPRDYAPGMPLHILHLLVVVIYITPVPCAASSVSIVDSTTAFPFLRTVQEANTILRWDSGSAIQLLSSCKLVRITRRGIRCIPAGTDLVAGWGEMFTRVGDPSDRCRPHSNALCVIGNGTRFFPTDHVFVTDSSTSKCVNGQGRVLIPDSNTSFMPLRLNFTVVHGGRDDISLCDILDTNLDVIYDPGANQIFTKQLNNSALLYVSISIFILIVVVLMAEALNNNTHSNLTHNIVIWIMLVGLSILMLVRVDDRMPPVITVHDQVFLVFIIVYITISTIYWIVTSLTAVPQHGGTPLSSINATPLMQATPGAKNHTPMAEIGSVGGPNKTLQAPITTSDAQRDGLNSMLASIQLATCVLYGTADNVYVSGIFFVLLFRCMQKLHSAHYNPEQWTIGANTIIVMDVTYTALVFLFAVLPHYTNDMDTVLYTAAQYVICDTIASNAVLSAAVTAHAANMAATATTPIKPLVATTPAQQHQLAQDRENAIVNSIGPANAGPEG
jgi:hypothetical protein